MSKQSNSIKIPVPEDFHFNECLVVLNRSPQEMLHQIQDGRILKLFNHNGENIFVDISAEPGHLHVRFPGGSPSPKACDAIESYIRDWFDLDRNLDPFYRMSANDPVLSEIAAAHRGLRVLGIPDLFEAMAWAVMGQQINLTFAYTLKKRLVERYGQSAEHEGVAYWTFPKPETIAALPVADLRDMQLTNRKAEYLIGIAAAIAKGELVKEQLMQKSEQSIEQTLLAIRGVGPWSANYIMMRCLKIPSAFPVADVGLHNALKQQLGLGQKPSLEEIKRYADRWKGWEGYATFYLWRTLYE